jgi:hypothetical protein
MTDRNCFSSMRKREMRYRRDFGGARRETAERNGFRLSVFGLNWLEMKRTASAVETSTTE